MTKAVNGEKNLAKRIDFRMDELFSSQSSSIDEEKMIKMENSAVPESMSRATKCGVKKFTVAEKEANRGKFPHYNSY